MTRTHHHRRFHLPKPNAANEGPEGWLQYGRKVQVTRCLTDCPIILQPKQQDGHAHNWLLCFMTIFIVVVTSILRWFVKIEVDESFSLRLVKYYKEAVMVSYHRSLTDSCKNINRIIVFLETSVNSSQKPEGLKKHSRANGKYQVFLSKWSKDTWILLAE